ncbi:MAG: ABC transporter permease [Acidobacteriota bacterium]
MQDAAREIRFALQALARRPGFTAVVVGTLGLGLGAATLIFSLVYSIAWQPLSYEDPERIVRLRPGGNFSKQAVLWLREQSHSYNGIAAYLNRGFVARDDEGSEVIYGPQVTANFFDVLGATAELGRTFRHGEDLRGTDPLVISHAYWQSRYGGRPDVLGEELTVTGVHRRVVGVMPPGFDFRNGEAQIAAPMFMNPDEAAFNEFWHLSVIARLKPGVTVAQAQDELRRLAPSWRDQLQGFPEDWGRDFRVVPLREAVAGEVRPALLLLLGAVGLLLLVATANVTNLLFVRLLGRRQETAIRLSLGASPSQLWRPLLTESTLLSLAGGLAGLLIAALGLRAVITLLPPETPRLGEIALHYPVYLFALVLAFATGYAATFLPALRTARASRVPNLARTTSSRARRRSSASLVVAEIALAVVLLVGAGLLIETFRNLQRVDPGLNADDLIVMRLGRETGSLSSGAEADAYYDRIEDGLAEVPGIESVAFALRIPFRESSWYDDLHRFDQPAETAVTSYWRPVSPGYFDTLGVGLRGRGFADTDAQDGIQVAVLNETAAQRLFPADDALGQRVQMPWEEREEGFLVVGIAEDIPIDGLEQPTPLTIYRPFSQTLPALEPMKALWRHIFLRTSVDPGSLLLPVRDAVHAVNTRAPIATFQPMVETIDETLAEKRALTWMLTLFAACALALGAIGIYGVIAYSVRQRRREMGIRLALGATSARIVGAVVGDGLKLSALGVTAGLLLAAGLTRLISGHVFGVRLLEPQVFATAAVGLVAVAVLATWGPARRAAGVNPIEVLKRD